MSKFVHIIGVVLLWLVTASGLLWWTFTASQVYEIEWAVLACVVVSIPALFTAFGFHRAWRWCWNWSNTRRVTARRLSSGSPPNGAASESHPELPDPL